MLRVLALTNLLTLSILILGSVHYQIPAKVMRFIESGQPRLGETNPNYEPAMELFELYGSARETVIAGDSHVARVAWAELLPEMSIVGRGINGDTTLGLQRRLADLSGYSSVLLLIGTNDVLKGESADEIAVRILRITARLAEANPAARVSVISVPPVASWIVRSDAFNRTVEGVNRQLHSAAQGGAFDLIDVHPLLEADEGSLSASKTTDGIHLNALGYLALRDKIRGHQPGERHQEVASQSNSGNRGQNAL